MISYKRSMGVPCRKIIDNKYYHNVPIHHNHNHNNMKRTNINQKIRNFIVLLSNDYVPSSCEIFKHISSTHYIKYVGIFNREHKKGIYFQFKNRIIENTLLKKLKHFEIKIESISTFKKVNGECIQDEHGSRPMPRGVQKM